MTSLFVLGQTDPADTSSAAALVFGVLALIGVVSILGLTARGRRFFMPLVAILLGLAIIATSISDARIAQVSALTVLGLFFGILLMIGGAGALREGVALPEVEGVEPSIDPPESFGE